ncbi:MAG: hypothetical protein RL254_1011 [Planctomycetota bacterium]|jgi:hypothetical protein
MTKPISNLAGSIDGLQSAIPIIGEFLPQVFRAQPGGGWLEEPGRGWIRNQLTASGLNRIANRAVQATGTTPFYILGVGTLTAAASLDSVNFGEVANGRKASISTGATAQSREWLFMTATWAGNADSVTSLALDSGAILCHASSGVGVVANIVNGMGVTLAASDYLFLTARIRVGSHDLSHTT